MTLNRSSKTAKTAAKTATKTAAKAPAKAAPAKRTTKAAPAKAAAPTRNARFSRTAKAAPATKTATAKLNRGTSANTKAAPTTKTAPANTGFGRLVDFFRDSDQKNLYLGDVRVHVTERGVEFSGGDRIGACDAAVNGYVNAAKMLSAALGTTVKGSQDDNGIHFTVGSNLLGTLNGYTNKDDSITVVFKLGNASTEAGVNMSLAAGMLLGADKIRTSGAQLTPSLVRVMSRMGYPVGTRSFYAGESAQISTGDAQAFIDGLSTPKAEKPARAGRSSGKATGNTRASNGNGRRWFRRG